MKKGEIWLVELPGIDGHEQHGFRPAILIADTLTSVVIVIPCTTNAQALRFPYTVRLRASERNGFETDSIALVLQIRAIDRARLQRKIGILEKSLLADINRVLQSLLF